MKTNNQHTILYIYLHIYAGTKLASPRFPSFNILQHDREYPEI